MTKPCNGNLMTYAPPETAARYLIETQPDGEWSLKVQRRGGALYPVGYTGDLEAIRAAFPSLDVESN